MAGGGGSKTTTVEKSEPWSEQAPYLKEVFGQAQALYRSNKPKHFAGSTVAGLSPETEAALRMQANRARAGSPLGTAAVNELQATLRGDYLGQANPYFAQMAQRVADTVTPQVNSQFAAAGRYGSGAQSGALGQALAHEIGALAYQNHADERANQQRALALAPELAQQDYADIDRLAAAGAQRDRLAQAQLDDRINRFNFEQQLPFNKLAQYQDLISGNYGGTRTATQRTSSSMGPLDAISGGLGLLGQFLRLFP
jgi:hypothetical protein